MQMIDDEPWFVAIDVCKALEINNSRMAIDRLDVDEKADVSLTDTSSNGVRQRRTFTIVSESGLYTLVLKSRKPEAKSFKRWITHEVIPSIRKHGGYLTQKKLEEALLNPDVLMELASNLKQEREKNAKLSATNSALALEANTWSDRSVLVALIRSYALRRCGNNFALAWNMFYKELRYSKHIDPKLRKARTLNDKILDRLTDEEIKIAVKQAVAMCEQLGIDTGKVINEVNQNNLSGEI